LFTGKAFYLPLSLTVAPSSNHVVSEWSLIVGVAGYLYKPTNNTPVLVCYGEAWSTPCFTGVYVVNSNGRGYVLVLSNNNGNGNSGRGLLYPLNNNNNGRVYSIVATVPPTAWIPILVVYFALLSRASVRSVKASYKLALIEHRVLGLALVLVLSINTILVGAVYVDQATPRYAVPGVTVKHSFHLENSTLVVTLDLSDVYVLESAKCVFNSKQTSNSNNRVNSVLESRVVNDNTILVVIPGYVYEYLYNKTILEPIPLLPANLSVYATIPVSCEFRLDKGVLRATFIAEFYWRDLVVSVRDSLVEIYNPNPVSLEAGVFIIDVERGRAVSSASVVLKPLSTTTLDLSVHGAGNYRVTVQYTLLGLRRSRVAYVVVS